MNILKSSILAVALLATAPLTYATIGEDQQAVVDGVNTLSFDDAVAYAKDHPALADRITARFATLHPILALKISGAVAKELPRKAVDIAGEVAAALPDKAAGIASTVANESPLKAVAIALAVTKSAPSQRDAIVRATAQIVPTKTAKITNAVQPTVNPVTDLDANMLAVIRKFFHADIITRDQKQRMIALIHRRHAVSPSN